MKKMNILNTMTRAGVRHAVYSPVRSHSILMFSMDEDESAVVSCLILFIITLWALLAKCSLYINNTGSTGSCWVCAYVFPFKVICVSYNFIF